MMTIEQLKEKVKKYLSEYRGEYYQLADDRILNDRWHPEIEVHDMSALALWCEIDCEDVMLNIYRGHDEEHGDDSKFCPSRDYFYVDVHGNFVSTDKKDYSSLMDEMVDDLVAGKLSTYNYPIPEDIVDMLNEAGIEIDY